ncbi:CD36 family protein [Necator americanus]|uniref:CD36 family protein n=1 Tax=Necator americanus TaxID=51031 RepID=W2SNB1_NECAM|nr:CD36 family protein [Necator americanus]ETN71150.1 CD36 family protein [Necator americanus]
MNFAIVCKMHKFQSMVSMKKELTPRWRLYAIGLLLLGAVLALFGMVMHLLFIPMIVNDNIRENTRLVEGSRMMESWMHPEYKILFKIFVHSIKNPDEIMEGAIPELSESGPYTFNRFITNKVISHNDGVVKFKRYSTYVFNETESCQTCILGNRIWIPNMIYQKFVEAASTTGMRAAATTLLSQTAFLEVEVGEFLFEGYKDPFLDKVCEIPFMNFVCDSILDLPERIGIFFESNNTADGVYEINDGVENPEDLGKIVSWNGKKWSSANARLIRGTEGMLFPPFLKKSDRIYVFISQLCRSVWLEFEKEVECEGVPAYRFVLPPEVFDPTIPENDGYCNPTDKKFFASQNETDDCFPAGLLEVSKCLRSQPPIMISLPNFNYASDEVRQSVKGLNSTDPERDSIFVDIEPRLGAVLRAQRRSQVNIEMWKGLDLVFPVNLNKTRSSLIPVLTIHEDAEIDPGTLDLIKNQLIRTEWWAHSITTALAGAGLAMMLIAVVYAVLKSDFLRAVKSDSVAPLPAYEPRGSANEKTVY